MKILYGVQGTGNGHITRARAMNKAFKKAGAEVDWIFSGRPRLLYNDMEPFGNFRALRGLTLQVRQSRVDYTRTLLKNNLFELYRDIQTVNVDAYDLVISDFEPITAWAARRAGKPVWGISHQSAFLFDIPRAGSHPGVNWLMRWFAPSTRPLGVHWHHFDQPILPPLLEFSDFENTPQAGLYVVYLPFADLDQLVNLLNEFPKQNFFVYSNVQSAQVKGNTRINPFSRHGFQRDLHNCEGVICNAGFELASEAIHLGRKLLVQPLQKQMEQQSNALALEQLGLGTVTEQISTAVLGSWLPQARPEARDYPNVADALASWLLQGGGDVSEICQALWSDFPRQSSGEISDELPNASIAS